MCQSGGALLTRTALVLLLLITQHFNTVLYYSWVDVLYCEHGAMWVGWGGVVGGVGCLWEGVRVGVCVWICVLMCLCA